MSDNTELKDKKAQEKEILEKRELRRRRRKRSQMISYVCLAAFALVLVGVIGGAAWYIGSLHKDRQETNASLVANIDDILGTEESLEKPEDIVETEPEPTPEEKLDEVINAAIEVMPLEDKIAGLFIVTPESITGVNAAVKAGDGTREALDKWAVGGVIYAERNIQSAQQLTEMLTNTAAYSRYPIFLAVEEEGGSVGAVAEKELADDVGDAADIGATADPQQAYTAGSTIAGYLTSLGFNLNFAPVTDFKSVENSFLKDRSYGTDTSVVASMVSSMVTGMEENGVSACLKYFPGVGSSTTDPHSEIVTSERTAEQFRAEDFPIYQAGIDAGVDFIMVSGMVIPAFTAADEISLPSFMTASLVTDVLRVELGFEGVIITDALNVPAITEYYDAGDASVRALKAGCDMLLMPEDFETAYNAVLEAVQQGVISEERINDSLRRIYRLKYANRLAE